MMKSQDSSPNTRSTSKNAPTQFFCFFNQKMGNVWKWPSQSAGRNPAETLCERFMCVNPPTSQSQSCMREWADMHNWSTWQGQSRCVYVRVYTHICSGISRTRTHVNMLPSESIEAARPTLWTAWNSDLSSHIHHLISNLSHQFIAKQKNRPCRSNTYGGEMTQTFQDVTS